MDFHVHSGLTDGTAYGYRVRSCNQGACSEWAETTATAGDQPVPLAPAMVSAAPNGPILIDVNWTPPADDGGSPIHQYHVTCSPDGQDWYAADCNEYHAYEWERTTSLDVEQGQRVYYRVRARNNNGFGVWSGTVSAQTAVGTPGAPSQPEPPGQRQALHGPVVGRS